jgi:hypothetical protein
LSVNKFNSFSYRQLYDLKKEIEKNIPITNISDDQNKIFVTFLDIDYAFENSVKLLALKKQIPISELVKPLTFKLSVDGTVKNSKFNYVAYSLCAYDLNDRQYASSKYHVLLALINANESYDISNYYMKKFKKKSLQNN